MHSEKIRKIYNNLTEETDSTDEIYGHLNKQILELLGEDEKRMDASEYGYYRDRLFQIASMAEESGFVRGFRYAFRLFLECMKE